MPYDEHLAHYVDRTGRLPVFGYVEFERYGAPFFETLLSFRLHHHLEIQLSLGLDEFPEALEVPIILPKGGFCCASDTIGGIRLSDGPRHPGLPVPEDIDL